ncbi:hypothetical protein ACJBYV_10365 [Streptococcus suis]
MYFIVVSVNNSISYRTIGKYRDYDDYVIVWTISELYDTSRTQSFRFDVGLDSSQAAPEY